MPLSLVLLPMGVVLPECSHLKGCFSLRSCVLGGNGHREQILSCLHRKEKRGSIVLWNMSWCHLSHCATAALAMLELLLPPFETCETLDQTMEFLRSFLR